MNQNEDSTPKEPQYLTLQPWDQITPILADDELDALLNGVLDPLTQLFTITDFD